MILLLAIPFYIVLTLAAMHFSTAAGLTLLALGAIAASGISAAWSN